MKYEADFIGSFEPMPIGAELSFLTPYGAYRIKVLGHATADEFRDYARKRHSIEMEVTGGVSRAGLPIEDLDNYIRTVPHFYRISSD